VKTGTNHTADPISGGSLQYGRLLPSIHRYQVISNPLNNEKSE